MIIPDANLLLYAHLDFSDWHEPALRWVKATLAGGEAIGLPWAIIQAFVRISTNPRSMRVALELTQAIEVVNGWLARPQVNILNPGDAHWELMAELAVACQCRGPLLTDAHLAALAIENGALLCSADRGFRRFPGMRWNTPLVA